MKKTRIVYFSEAGSTRKVAQAVAAGLRGAGHDVDLHDLTTGRPPSPIGYDAFGIGTPVYVFRPPFTVSRYLDGLPDLNGLPLFVLLQSAGLEVDAGNAAHTASREERTCSEPLRRSPRGACTSSWWERRSCSPRTCS